MSSSPATDASAEASAKRRLRDALTLLESGAIPECPVCLEQPLRADARILRCCAGILCRSCIPQCLGTCPLCRQRFEAVESHTDRSAACGESPFTYTFQEYTHLDYGSCYVSTGADGSAVSYGHSGFGATNDYNCNSESYSYSHSELAADRSSTYEYSFSNFTASDYTAQDYSDISRRYGVC